MVSDEDKSRVKVKAKAKIHRTPDTQIHTIIVGAGLGGLGAAISILLAGHAVLVLESAQSISEVGAGIQILPNASHVLQTWGLLSSLEKHATKPRCVNMRHWKGQLISSMDTAASAAKYPGTWYWDFHRASLHRCLLERARELGAVVRCDARVVDVKCGEEGARVVVVDREGRRSEESADLVVGADGINSRLREIMLGREDPPVRTGDLAYRLLLSTKDMMRDEELRDFVTDPQVNYWLGPDMHAVNYVLKGGELFNMVLLVPDDMPAGASTLEGNVEEMRALYKDWDPRMCASVQKWRLCIRSSMPTWSHPSSTFTLLGDAVHATLPYLASGAGMSLEDAAVLGECLSRFPTTKIPPQARRQFKRRALDVYEMCRRDRTRMVVERGNLQQYLYHLPDGREQEERDRMMRMVPTPAGEALAWRDPELSPRLLGYDYLEDVEKIWGKESRALRSKL